MSALTELTNTEALRTVHERIVAELSPPPTARSADRPWAGMSVQLHDWHTGGSVISPVVDHDILAMRVTGNVKLTQHRAGRVHRGVAKPGNITTHPRGFESRWSWDRPGAIVIVRVPQAVLLQAADASMKRAEDIEIRNCFGEQDPFIEPIMNLFAQELWRPAHSMQELISGCLSVALASHLVHRFNVRATAHQTSPGGLEPNALRRVIEYMHTPSSVPITLTALADVAGVSRFHFPGMFRRSVGEGPVQHLQRIHRNRAPKTIESPHPTSQRAISAKTHKSLQAWQIKRVTDHMTQQLDRVMSLDELAGLLDLSRSYFCTVFRVTVGQTPREWLIDRRVERARELLRNSNQSITQIALAVGYTPSAFGVVFRNRVGMTPSAYRGTQ